MEKQKTLKSVYINLYNGIISEKDQQEREFMVMLLDKVVERLKENDIQDYEKFTDNFLKNNMGLALKSIKKIIDEYFNIDTAKHSRSPKYAYPRQIYCYFGMAVKDKYPAITLRLIGDLVGIDHATVLHNADKIQGTKGIYKNVLVDIKNIIQLIDFDFGERIDIGNHIDNN